MKKCLFTPEQIKIYEFLTKPHLFYDKDSKKEIFTLNELVPIFHSKKVEKTMELIDDFNKRIMTETRPNHIDKTLFNMLDKDLKEDLTEADTAGLK